jgi:ABC-type antimicrobial peptide transport system permease subunit
LERLAFRKQHRYEREDSDDTDLHCCGGSFNACDRNDVLGSGCPECSQEAVGETIRVRDLPCVVVGVLEVKGPTATGQDQDDTVLMPYTTVMKKIKGQPWLDDILGNATSATVVDQVEQEMTALLRERHHISPGGSDDFNMRHPTEIAEMVRQSTQTLEVLLAAVASVSLVVGGIGIMNIMLVSVTERTRKIGLRQAVGARGRANASSGRPSPPRAATSQVPRRLWCRI